MLNENEQRAANKAAIDADNAAKTDLEHGADAIVGDGTEIAPVRSDAFEQRKTLFKKSQSLRESRIAIEAEQHPDVANALDAVEAEADQKGSRNELDRGSHVDTNRTEPAREPILNKPKAGVEELPERVIVRVLGQDYDVPKEDVIEAGGLKTYQLERAASMRLQHAAAREAEVKAGAEALKQEREVFDKLRASAGSQTPAKVPVGTPGAAPIHADGAGDDADVERQASDIVMDLYSGDPKRAQSAIAQVLKVSKAPVATLDPAEVARQAADILRKQDSAPAPAIPPVDAKFTVEVEELNAMMALKFPDLLKNEELRNKALAKFNELKVAPENRHRRLVDIGRDAARAIEGAGPHPRQDVIARKRELPPAVTGVQAQKAAQPDQPLTQSGAIEQMRRARGLPS